MRRAAFASGWGAPVAAGVLGLCLAACDPVHTDEIAALGGEAPGVPRGPTHRPGQPCLLCHDGGRAHEFSVAGTVFESPLNSQGASGVTVTMVDSAGSMYAATTNAVGNFYVTPDEWTPAYPLPSTTLTDGHVSTPMYSEIARNGSCAGCHTNPASPTSPGQVSLVPP
jgi:hypothetical protein